WLLAAENGVTVTQLGSRAVEANAVFVRNQEALMKKLFAVLAVAVMGIGTAFAGGPTSPTTDVLGAHLVYGRGCAACHVPHSGTLGNGATQLKPGNNGVEALWGQDMS